MDLDAETTEIHSDQDIKVGDKFSSLEECEASIKAFCETNSCVITESEFEACMVHRNSKETRCTPRLVNKYSGYRYLRFGCKHKDVLRIHLIGRTLRTKSRVVNASCPAGVSLIVDKKSGTLEVTSVTLQHRHEKEEVFLQYPEIKPVVKRSEQEARDMLELGFVVRCF